MFYDDVLDSIELQRPVLRLGKIQCYQDRQQIVVVGNVVVVVFAGRVVVTMMEEPLYALVVADEFYEMYEFCVAMAYLAVDLSLEMWAMMSRNSNDNYWPMHIEWAMPLLLCQALFVAVNDAVGLGGDDDDGADDGGRPFVGDVVVFAFDDVQCVGELSSMREMGP